MTDVDVALYADRGEFNAGEPLAIPSCFHPSQPDQVAEALASLDVASPVVVEVVRLTWAGGLLSEADKALLGSAVEWAGPWIDHGSERMS